MTQRNRMGLVASAGAFALLSVMTWAQAPTPPNQIPELPMGTGLIAGQVVDADTGRGIPAASVALIFSQVNVSGRGGQAMTRPLAVIADSQGRFFFAGLPAMRYQLESSMHGYSAVASSQPVDVGEGAKVANVKLTLRKLSSLSGRLVDDSGDPVVSMEVIAWRRVVIQGRPQLSAAARSRSNDRGEYRLGNLTTGDYLVCACARDPIPLDGYVLTTLAARPLDLLGAAGRAATAGADAVAVERALTTLPPTLYPNATVVSRAERLTLKGGEDKVGVDITMTAVPGVRVSGRVVGATSTVTASFFRLTPVTDLPEAVSLTQVPPMLVQPDGRFDFANVPPGTYRLDVTFTPGMRGGGPSGAALAFLGGRGAAMAAPPPPPQRGGGPANPELDPLWASELISVGDRDVTGLVIGLNRSLVVSGTVIFSGSAPQPTSQALQRPIFQLVSADPTVQARLMFGGIQPDGSFEVRGLRPGRYAVVSFPMPGFPTLRSITGNGQDLTDKYLSLDGSDLTGLAITYTDTPATTVQGRIDGTLDPAEPRYVWLFPAERTYWQEPFAAQRRFRGVRVSPTGEFNVSGLPPGEYLAVSSTESGADWMQAERLEKLAASAERFRLSDGEKISLEVRR